MISFFGYKSNQTYNQEQKAQGPDVGIIIDYESHYEPYDTEGKEYSI